MYFQKAYQEYLTVRLFGGFEMLLSLASMLAIFLALSLLIKRRVSVAYSCGEDAESASMHGTEKLQKSILLKLSIGAGFFGVSGILGIIDFVLRPRFAFLWIPASILGAVGLLVFWLPAFREATDDSVTFRNE